MRINKDFQTAFIFLFLFLFQGCDMVKEVISTIKEVKDMAEQTAMGKERDVYKPIREGRVSLELLPNGPELMTWERYYAQRHDWHLKTYVDNYEKYGHRSAEWDHKVRKMLADYAVFRKEKTSKIFMQGLLDQVDHILELGCNDPRVICIKGILLYNRKNAVDAAPFLNQGLALLEKSDYPKRYSFFAASHLCQVYGNSQGADNPWHSYHRKKMRYMGQAAADQDYKDGHQRYYMEDFIFVFNGRNCRMPEDAGICMDEIPRSEDIDPWISLVTRGIYHIANGWRYRGTGYAKSVSQEGWKKFKAEIEEARKCLNQAYELHPEYPEAASNMIRVAMASSRIINEKQWFNRAVKAHFDYLNAYENLLWAIRPRWGGSHEQMLRFGIECLNTQRFDTRVPSNFLVSLFQIGDELDNWRTPYQWPGIYDLIQQYFNGLINEPKNRDRYEADKSFYAVVAWAAGQYEDARDIIQELGTKFDTRAYGYLKVTQDQVLNDIRNHL